MKKILTAISLLFCTLNANAKNEFTHAKVLRAYIVNEKFIHDIRGKFSDDIELMLLAHLSPIQEISTYIDNPFIGSFFDAAALNYYGNEKPKDAASPFSPGGAIGGLDVTAIADGIAQFLVERTKEELNEAFFRKFKAYLDNYPEFRTLFPYTNSFVNNFNSWEYANLIGTLREAFDKDIKSLLVNIPKLQNLVAVTECATCDKKQRDSCEKRIGAISEFLKTNNGRYLLSSMYLVNGMLNQERIVDIVDTLCGEHYLGGYKNATSETTTNNVKNSVKLVNIINNSIRSNSSDRSYISGSELQELLSDPILARLFLGLLYQEIITKGIQFPGIQTNQVTACLNIRNMPNLVRYFVAMAKKSDDIENAMNNLKLHKFDRDYDNSQDYSIIITSTNGLLQDFSNISSVCPSITIPAEVTTVFTYINYCLPIGYDIAVRNYNAVVMDVLKILTNSEIVGTANLTKFNASFLKYGSFAANVVNAKDADEIKESIKSFVLPSGSSSIKKHTQFSISINSYVGFFCGSQGSDNTTYTIMNNGVIDTVPVNIGSTYGVYAPIGLAFNWGLGWKTKTPGSITLFASVFDLGAIVGYRFVTDTGTLANTTKVNLSNVLAPGINLTIGLPNMPVSIGGGYQYIPTLQRDASSNKFYNLDQSGHRWQVFLAVDLPLLNIHTSKKSLLYSK